MTDKVQKIREEVERLFNHVKDSNLESDSGAFYYLKDLLDFIDSLQEELVSIWHDTSELPQEGSLILREIGISQKGYGVIRYSKESQDFPIQKWAYVDDLLNLSNVQRTAKDWNEIPLSNDLKEAADNALESITDQYDIISVGSCLEMFRLGAEWQKTQEYTCYEEAFEDGAKWKIENLWKPADGDNLPEIDREVVVLTQPYPLENLEYAVSFAHRPNPNGWDGKSITTDKIEHYTPKTYDKGGWNIPDVKFWLDVELPKRNRTMSKYTEGEFDSIVCPHWFRAGGIEGCTAGMPPSCSECNHPDKRIEKVKWSSISTEN